MATALWAPSPTLTLAGRSCHSSRLAGRLSSSVCASNYVCRVGSRTPQSAANLTPLRVRRGSPWVCQARRKASRRVEAEDESELEDDDLRNGLNEVRRSTSFSRLHFSTTILVWWNCPIVATQILAPGCGNVECR
jgi:hypothetical protein